MLSAVYIVLLFSVPGISFIYDLLQLTKAFKKAGVEIVFVSTLFHSPFFVVEIPIMGMIWAFDKKCREGIVTSLQTGVCSNFEFKEGQKEQLDKILLHYREKYV